MQQPKWEARRTTDGELGRVGSVLAAAFQDDPMWRWALGRDATDERRARLDRFFGALVRKVYAGKELVFTAGDFAGSAVWTPPGAWKFSLADEARVAPAVLGAFGAAGTVRLLQLLAGVERVHLREPHYYLFAIGADPAHQGRGVGAALLAPMLARCDAERMPAYLESSNPANLTFYRRHGFVESGPALRFGTDVTVTPMRRGPA
ncbi:MAG TPA: GNAT family N-acetyltransferase [Polyangia bacterium]|nr:GNAT family N-acetyltransferase [Polyangia bacterium]